MDPRQLALVGVFSFQEDGTMPLNNADVYAAEPLSHGNLVLAVAQAQLDGRGVEDVQALLWRENSGEVATIFSKVETWFLDQHPESGIGLDAARLRQVTQEARKAAPRPRGGIGLTLEDVAECAEMDRATLVALMEHHGLLAMSPCGPGKNRRLATDATIIQGLGHNVDPRRKRVGAVEGYGKSAPFPVFYADRLADVLWVLDLKGIRAETAQREDRTERLAWLLDQHGYLPGSELASLSGYSLRTVRAAQAARTALAGYEKDDEEKTAGPAFSLLGWARENLPTLQGELHSQVMRGEDREMSRKAA